MSERLTRPGEVTGVEDRCGPWILRRVSDVKAHDNRTVHEK